MKKLIVALLLVFYSAGVFAHDRYRNRHSHRIYDRSVHWIVPAMAGVVVGTVIHRHPGSVEPIYVPPPVYVERRSVEPQCSEWREIQQDDGTIIRERYCRK
jgi:hypothetical protein